MAVVWKMSIFSANAEKCYQEILSIGKAATPQQILDYARNPDSELHKCFEWDDTVAAEKYRLQQARTVVCQLVHVDEKKPEPQKIRLLQRASEGYMPIRMIVRNELEYEKLLERARAELRAFKQRYHTLVELEEILALID
jgi:anion-transporting  ArsA/GET3 family ATPase